MKAIYLIIILQLFNVQKAYNQQLLEKKLSKLKVGGELGLNQIISSSYIHGKNSIQLGLRLDLCLNRYVSLVCRFKYFKTGTSFFIEGKPGGIISNGQDEYSGDFMAENIVIPICLNLESNMFGKINGFIKTGIAFTSEYQKLYRNYSTNIEYNKFPNNYLSMNVGMGIEFIQSKKKTIYVEYEFFRGAKKGYSEGFWGRTNYRVYNANLNIGFKYSIR